MGFEDFQCKLLEGDLDFRRLQVSAVRVLGFGERAEAYNETRQFFSIAQSCHVLGFLSDDTTSASG